MITPEEFPYVKSLYVNDCYTYKDFNIELHDYKPFSHLILTGKNGSGKSTILQILSNHISHWRKNNVFDPFMLRGNDWKTVLYAKEKLKDLEVLEDEHRGESNSKYSSKRNSQAFARVIPFFMNYPSSLGDDSRKDIVSVFLQADRKSKPNRVSTVTKGDEFDEKITDSHTDFYIKQFKQYLVNKKVSQAFSQIDNDTNNWQEHEEFFKRLTSALRSIFEDDDLNLIFFRESFDFELKLSGNRRINLDTLSDGFSALISIIADLFVRVDIIRKRNRSYNYNPCGIVLIDEPETHLHLQMQEQVLPLLTSLFPNIQFIVATHSPAVVASIKQTTIFDLSTKESRISEDTVGRSYSDLMTTHFGLNNEYSTAADEIIKQVNDVLNSPDKGRIEKKQALQAIYDTNSAYLSPTLKVELEMLIVQHDVQQELK